MALTKLVSMREALARDDLLGRALPGDSWFPHRTLLIAALGEQLITDEERAIFATITGNRPPPTAQTDELVSIMGRRSGKTRMAGSLAAYVGTLVKHSEYLANGERATIPVLAGSTIQARASFQAVLGVLEESPVLSRQIENSNTETIRLKSRCDIEVRPASFRTIRGITSPLICADEVSTWYNDETNANSDIEILTAARPALASTGGLIFTYSSPWAKKGELWTAHTRHFAKDSAILVAKASTATMNPTIPERVIQEAYERDPFRAAAEYGAEFRDGISALLTREMVDAACDHDRNESAPVEGVQYIAFTDPSGGAVDSYCLAIGHLEDGVAVIDAIREAKPPFSPEAITAEFATLCKSYKCFTATGDRYAGHWPREQWAKHGVTYQTSHRTASDIFADVVPLFTSQRIAFPNSQVAINEFACLERRTTRGGKATISHPPGGHDDLAVTIAGTATLLVGKSRQSEFMLSAPIFLDPYHDYTQFDDI
ncbi:hypothetical protein QBK99_08160 [Corticibacterium sp. UT-5YL-CI-8]|nr:hypothetical protein [Tianweitania sp. UT-5YL-CI-8]